MKEIIIDALGSDLGPQMVRDALEIAGSKRDFKAKIVGPEDVFSDLIRNNKNFSLIACQDYITNDESPALAIRRKKNSSTVLGLEALNAGGDVFLSAGSTGALLAGGYFISKRLPGFKRACLAPVIPNLNGDLLMADVGASMDVDPKALFQFAELTSVYVGRVMHKDSPGIALLNIGSEADKGDKRARETYELLQDSELNFIGNVEARDIVTADVDIIITDGFSGNIALKALEGTAKVLLKLLKDTFMKNIKTKIAALMLKDDLKKTMSRLDYKAHGGAPLLGLRKALYKAHGNSDANTFALAIIEALDYAESGVMDYLLDKYIKEKEGPDND